MDDETFPATFFLFAFSGQVRAAGHQPGRRTRTVKETAIFFHLYTFVNSTQHLTSSGRGAGRTDPAKCGSGGHVVLARVRVVVS